MKKEELPSNIEIILTSAAWAELQESMKHGKDITIVGSQLQFNHVNIPGADGDVARIDVIIKKMKDV